MIKRPSMKIAFFHELTPLSGARKVVEEYGKILGKKHEIDLYYIDGKEDPYISKNFGNIYFFKFVSNKSRIYRDSIELIKLFFLHRKIAKIIQEKKYDFIFINPSKFTQSPFLLRMVNKTIYFCQEPLRIAYDPLLKVPNNLNIVKKLYENINRFNRKLIDSSNLSKAKIVLANSLYSKNNIKKAYGVNPELCYLGVNSNNFILAKSKKNIDILFIGQKEFIEGYDLFKKAFLLFEKKPTVKFIERDASGKGLSEKNLISEINKSKIVLALSRNEPFGLIPLESMACGVPVIAVSEGGYAESTINGKTGFLISRNPQELKDKIDLLLLNDKLRAEMGKNGRQLVLDKFTWKRSVSTFLSIAKRMMR